VLPLTGSAARVISGFVMGVLRKLFGHRREEVWRELCRQIGGDFVGGGFWRGDKVRAHVDEWTVTLDTYTVSTGKVTVVYTRLRAPYVNRDGFRFVVYRRTAFSGLGKLLGMQDIEVGYSDFDRDLIIKGNDEVKLRALFANERIRTLLAAQPDIHMSVKDDEGWFGATFPEGVDELNFQVHGVITDVARLKALYDLFGEVLHQLCHIGSAYENDPGLVL